MTPGVIIFPGYVTKILDRLERSGYESYAVGGCVRDSLIGRIPHDWDVATGAKPCEMLKLFSAEGFSVACDAGIKHGTVAVRCGDDICEVTTFRCDGEYEDHRRPNSVEFSDSVVCDLARRDFTMNAVAARPDGDGNVKIIDPFRGAEDIKNKILRSVGDPEVRFSEDALRILRAVRFSSELGFDAEENTAAAAVKLKETLSFVSVERITSELWRTLCGSFIGMAISRFGDIIRYIAVTDAGGSFFKYIGETENPAVRLALLARDSGNIDEFFSRFRFPSRVKSLVLKLIKECMPPQNSAEVSSLLEKFECDIETAAEYIRIQQLICGDTGSAGVEELLEEIQRIKDRGIPYRISMLPVNGNDLLAYGIEACNIGSVLRMLLEEVRLGRISDDREALLEFLKLNY